MRDRTLGRKTTVHVIPTEPVIVWHFSPRPRHHCVDRYALQSLLNYYMFGIEFPTWQLIHPLTPSLRTPDPRSVIAARFGVYPMYISVSQVDLTCTSIAYSPTTITVNVYPAQFRLRLRQSRCSAGFSSPFAPWHPKTSISSFVHPPSTSAESSSMLVGNGGRKFAVAMSMWWWSSIGPHA
jgi:hypothetical protein